MTTKCKLKRGKRSRKQPVLAASVGVPHCAQVHSLTRRLKVSFLCMQAASSKQQAANTVAATGFAVTVMEKACLACPGISDHAHVQDVRHSLQALAIKLIKTCPNAFYHFGYAQSRVDNGVRARCPRDCPWAVHELCPWTVDVDAVVLTRAAICPWTVVSWSRGLQEKPWTAQLSENHGHI